MSGWSRALSVRATSASSPTASKMASACSCDSTAFWLALSAQSAFPCARRLRPWSRSSPSRRAIASAAWDRARDRCRSTCSCWRAAAISRSMTTGWRYSGLWSRQVARLASSVSLLRVSTASSSIALKARPLELAPQPSKAASSREPDRAGRHAEHRGDLGVPTCRCLVEQHADDLAASRRERRNRVAQDLIALQIRHHVLRGGLPKSRLLEGVRFLEAFGTELPLAPLPPPAFAHGRLNQPLRQAVRVPEPGQLGQQIQRNHLKDVAGVGLRKPVIDGSRKDQVLVLVEEGGPCLLVAISAACNETAVGPAWRPFDHGLLEVVQLCHGRLAPMQAGRPLKVAGFCACSGESRPISVARLDVPFLVMKDSTTDPCSPLLHAMPSPMRR